MIRDPIPSSAASGAHESTGGDPDHTPGNPGSQSLKSPEFKKVSEIFEEIFSTFQHSD